MRKRCAEPGSLDTISFDAADQILEGNRKASVHGFAIKHVMGDPAAQKVMQVGAEE